MTDDIEPLSDAELERVIHDHRPKFAYQSNKVDDLTKVCHACRPRHNEMLTLAPCLAYRLAVEMKESRTKELTHDHD